MMMAFKLNLLIALVCCLVGSLHRGTYAENFATSESSARRAGLRAALLSPSSANYHYILSIGRKPASSSATERESLRLTCRVRRSAHVLSTGRTVVVVVVVVVVAATIYSVDRVDPPVLAAHIPLPPHPPHPSHAVALAQDCPGNFTAATSSGDYVFYFGSSAESNCCEANSLAQSCGINVWCSDTNSDVDTGAFVPYSNCNDGSSILVGSGANATLSCQDYVSAYLDRASAAAQAGAACNADVLLTRREALSKCGPNAFSCALAAISQEGDNADVCKGAAESAGLPATPDECPAEFAPAQNGQVGQVLFIGRSNNATNLNVTESCCDDYGLEMKCGIDVLCPNPVNYKAEYGNFFTFQSCLTSGDVLLNLDQASNPLSCDDAFAFAYQRFNESGCDSDAFKNANAQALSACGAPPYQCLANSIGGFCGVGVQDTNAQACVTAAQEALVASQVNGCNSQEYFQALGKATGICGADAPEVLAATVGNTCPTTCLAAKDNLRRTASVVYTGCGTNAYYQAADIVINLCGAEEYHRLNAQLCTPPVDSCQVALEKAIAAANYGCSSRQWVDAVTAATSVCSYEKVSAAMANAGVYCPISCDAALYQAGSVAKWHGCDTWKYYSAKSTAVAFCGWSKFWWAEHVFNWCAPPPPPTPPSPPPPQPSLCSENITPGGPSNVQTTSVGTDTATLSWSPPSNKGCVSYYDVVAVPRTSAVSSQFFFNHGIKVQYGQSIVLTGLTSGTTYDVTITSFSDTRGQGGSTDTAFTTVAAPPTPTPSSGDVTCTPPSQPSGLAASAVTETSATVSWTGSGTADCPETYIVTLNGVDQTVDTTSASFTGLTPETTYQVSVMAISDAGSSSPAATEFTTAAAAVQPDQTPAAEPPVAEPPAAEPTPAPEPPAAEPTPPPPEPPVVEPNQTPAAEPTPPPEPPAVEPTPPPEPPAVEPPPPPACSAPATPGDVGAVATDTTAAVSWSASSPDGGCPVTYTVTVGGVTQTTSNTNASFEGLSPGTTYTISVVATNEAGSSGAGTGSFTTSAPPPVPPPEPPVPPPEPPVPPPEPPAERR